MKNYDIKVLSKIRLYGTDGCHLCHEAMVLCEQELDYLPTEVEITDFSEFLYQQYEIRIPVLVFQYSQAQSPSNESTVMELAWPFNAEALHVFLTKCSDIS